MNNQANQEQKKEIYHPCAKCWRHTKYTYCYGHFKQEQERKAGETHDARS